MNTPLLLAVARTLQARANHLRRHVKKNKLNALTAASSSLRNARRTLHEAYIVLYSPLNSKTARAKATKAAAALHQEMIACTNVLIATVPPKNHDSEFYKTIQGLKAIKPKDDGSNPIPPPPPAPSGTFVGPIGPLPPPVGPSDPGYLHAITHMIETCMRTDEIRIKNLTKLQAEVAQLNTH